MNTVSCPEGNIGEYSERTRQQKARGKLIQSNPYCEFGNIEIKLNGVNHESVFCFKICKTTYDKYGFCIFALTM